MWNLPQSCGGVPAQTPRQIRFPEEGPPAPRHPVWRALWRALEWALRLPDDPPLPLIIIGSLLFFAGGLFGFFLSLNAGVTVMRITLTAFGIDPPVTGESSIWHVVGIFGGIGAFGVLIWAAYTAGAKFRRWVLESPKPQEKVSDLQLALLRYGALAEGVVNRVDGDRVEVRWELPDGEEMSRWFDRLPAAPDGFDLDSEAAVLYDPASPEDAVVPTAWGISFAPPDPQGADDCRPTRPLDCPRPTEQEAICSFTAEMMATPTPIARPILQTVWRRLRSANRDPTVARLEVESPELVVSWRGEEENLRLTLDENFYVNLSVWRVDDAFLDLNVELRQQSAPRPVQFRCRMPQRDVSARLPVKLDIFPYVSLADLRRLWPVILFYAQSHGRELESAVIWRR